MIRFVYVGGQIMSHDQQFAFYDTVSDKFVAVADQQLFDSSKDLEECLEAEQSSADWAERLIHKVWQPYDGHVVGMIDRLVENVDTAIDKESPLHDAMLYGLEYVRKFVIQMEVEREQERERIDDPCSHANVVKYARFCIDCGFPLT